MFIEQLIAWITSWRKTLAKAVSGCWVTIVIVRSLLSHQPRQSPPEQDSTHSTVYRSPSTFTVDGLFVLLNFIVNPLHCIVYSWLAV